MPSRHRCTGLLREPGPRTRDRTFAERVERQTFTAQHVQHGLFALADQQLAKLLRLLEDVGVVTTGHTAVAGHDQHCGTLRVLALVEQGVIQRRRRARQFREDLGDLLGVRLGCCHSGLGLRDARRRDQFLRLGDLLGRVDRLDPRAELTQVRHSSITLPSLDAGSWSPHSLANGGALDGDLLLLDLVGSESLGLRVVHDAAAVGGDEAFLELVGCGLEASADSSVSALPPEICS